MRWVRNPWWDGFWLLSGLPIGIVLMLYVRDARIASVFILIMILETAHVVSPIILAWTRPELRAIVSREWIKHIVAPVAVMVGVMIAPVAWVMGLYCVWNIYHFGMQNFGVSSLYWRSHRQMRKWLCLGVTALGMGAQLLLAPAYVVGMFAPHHWFTDIGLSSRIARWHWAFIAGVLMIGVAWFALRQGPLSVRLVPQIGVIRAGIGMIHFIYSARIWKFSDPRVRAIGRDLFRQRQGTPCERIATAEAR